MAETFKCRVKPLVWEDGERVSFARIPTIVGPESAWYETEEVDRDGNCRMILCVDRRGYEHISDPALLDEMKLAAQKDYVARVKALLEIEEEK